MNDQADPIKNPDPNTTDDSEDQINDFSEEIIEDENQSKGVDPLAELRQDMYDEEQTPDPLPKQDLLQRMTGTLASRKVPTRPRPQNPMDQSFGILNNRSLPPADSTYRPNPTPNEEIRDDFLETRLGTGPLSGKPSGFGAGREDSAPIHIEGDPKAQGGLFSQAPSHADMPAESKVQSRVHRRLDPLWDGADPEDNEDPSQSLPISAEITSRPMEERKMLVSGNERQYQVNKFLSYNPNKTWSDRLRELTKAERILLITLIIAVLIVTGLIIYLYIDSRASDGPALSPTVAVVAPPVSTPIQKVPVPTGMKLPGGWTFQLASGSLVDGKWNPKTSEWLSGTEIRRVIAIPWNKQIEAVVNTFEPNLPIELYMNNGDTLRFKIQSVSMVPVSDSSVMSDTRPSLAIILINPGEDKRWVVIAYP